MNFEIIAILVYSFSNFELATLNKKTGVVRKRTKDVARPCSSASLKTAGRCERSLFRHDNGRSLPKHQEGSISLRPSLERATVERRYTLALSVLACHPVFFRGGGGGPAVLISNLDHYSTVTADDWDGRCVRHSILIHCTAIVGSVESVSSHGPTLANPSRLAAEE